MAIRQSPKLRIEWVFSGWLLCTTRSSKRTRSSVSATERIRDVRHRSPTSRGWTQEAHRLDRGHGVALVASLTALALVLFGVIPGIGGGSGEGGAQIEGAEEPGAAAFMVADLVNPSSLITPIKKGAPIPALPAASPAVNGTTPRPLRRQRH